MCFRSGAGIKHGFEALDFAHRGLTGNTLRYYFLTMRVTQKGQVTIPQEMRLRFGLNPHTEVEFGYGKNGVIIRPVRSEKTKFRAWLDSAKGSATAGQTTEAIMKLTRGED